MAPADTAGAGHGGSSWAGSGSTRCAASSSDGERCAAIWVATRAGGGDDARCARPGVGGGGADVAARCPGTGGGADARRSFGWVGTCDGRDGIGGGAELRSACTAPLERGVLRGCGTGCDSGGIVLPRSGSAVDIRSCDVECGARPRGSGSTSPAPRSAGTGDVSRDGWSRDATEPSAAAGAGARSVDAWAGDPKRSAPGSGSAGCLLFCTSSISSFTAVDSVLAMDALPRKVAAKNRELTGSQQRKSPDCRCDV